jgi:hypothetical protein
MKTNIRMPRAFQLFASLGVLLVSAYGASTSATKPKSKASAQAKPVAIKPVSATAIRYTLPTTGPLPRTYRVTLAITDAKNPNWLVSTFLSGAVRTVTAANKGVFTETWDGLDDNYMPVPAGTYGVKGIYMPAEKWKIDGEYHSITAKLASSGTDWAQRPEQDNLPPKIYGDPVASPLADVDVAAGGKGVLYFTYMENAKNNYEIDFSKPVGYEQIIGGYGSGGAAGGPATATDGTTTWSYSADGGQKFIYRADGKPFGNQNGLFRNGVYLPAGWVSGMAAWREAGAAKTVVFETLRGNFADNPLYPNNYIESTTGFTNRLIALDGDSAQVLGEWTVERPNSVVVRNGKVFVLHRAGEGFAVSQFALQGDWKTAKLQPVFTVPQKIQPFDLEVDSHGRFYLSDSNANHVYQFDSQGKQVLTYGKQDSQEPGKYDPQTLMQPQKLGVWTDSKGEDRLLIVEAAGPNRLSEWSAANGQLLREWMTPQTRANDGYAVDPRHADQIYMDGQGNSLVQWQVDYKTGKWTPKAVWPGVGTGRLEPRRLSPRILYRGETKYLLYGGNYSIYKLEGNRWRASAAILTDEKNNERKRYIWRDENGDGEIQESEYRSNVTSNPPGTLRYWGESWQDDFSLVAIGQGTSDIWRLAPTGFDKHGNPIFAPDGWKKLLTDPIFAARSKGTASAIRGGNEIDDNYSSDWAMITKAPDGGYYVSARGGPNFSANGGAQYKLSRYVPDGRGGYSLKWRTGRVALQGVARPGEVYAPIYVTRPINGLVGVTDNARAGLVIYTEDGLYVDTILADERRMTHEAMGAYFGPGEFFAGYNYLNPQNNQVYLAFGKTYPIIYELDGWTAKSDLVQPLKLASTQVTLQASQIASPPEIALQVRGGAGAARIARINPSPGGGPALDGSLEGWESSIPIQFKASEDQTVETRVLYDPQHIYIRWHARLGHEFEAKALNPPERMFTHDRRADTLGFYLQGDPKASSSTVGGRAGDVRFVFGLFKNEANEIQPAVLGMYPKWHGEGKAKPLTYRTPVGSVAFEHVGLLEIFAANHKLDADNKGFTLAVAIPRAALPPGINLAEGGQTTANFDANLGGNNRFWWANADGSASRETYDEPTEARLYPGSWAQAQFVPMNNLPLRNWMAIGPFADAEFTKLDRESGRSKMTEVLAKTVYPPQTDRDMKATYDGNIAQTRLSRRTLTWKPVSITGDKVDLRTLLGWPNGDEEGAAYLLTNVYSPKEQEVRLEVAGDTIGQYGIRGWLNNAPLPLVENTRAGTFRIDSKQPIKLRAGWNELLVRYDHIWGNQILGARLVAPTEVLWQLKNSALAPK